MLRLIRFLFTGDWHLHKWVILEREKCQIAGTKQIGHLILLQCEVCGKTKSIVEAG